MIVGGPGVGKTALADGIAMRIADRNVPVNLIGKRIVSLDMGALVAGTKYRGDFEDRLKRIMEAVRNDSSIILFIDEIHNIVGAGSSAGAMDAAAHTQAGTFQRRIPMHRHHYLGRIPQDHRKGRGTGPPFPENNCRPTFRGRGDTDTERTEASLRELPRRDIHPRSPNGMHLTLYKIHP